MSIGIVVLISSIVLFNYSKFNDNIAVSTSAQEMSIAVRQAQVYGITVKESGAGTGNFNYSYGIAFDPISYPTSYFIFVDRNGDKKFGGPDGCGGNASECVEIINLRNGVRITSICDGTSCPPGQARKSTILFTRPNPDPSVYYFDSNGVQVNGLTFPTKVQLSSPRGNSMTVTIERTGQIQKS